MKNNNFHYLLLLVGLFSFAVADAQPGYPANKGYDDDERDDYTNGHYDRNRYDRNPSRNDRYYQAVYVKHKPRIPRNVKSVRPSRRHIWVGEDWIYTRGAYRYQPGYWVIPARGRHFVEGHWERVRKGWYWVPGFWTRGAYRS